MKCANDLPAICSLDEDDEASVVINRDQRVIRIEGTIKEDAMEVVYAIININAEDNYYDSQVEGFERMPITIYLDTDGGDLNVTESIVEAINLSVTPINVIGMRKVFSAGAYILTTSPKGKRYLMKNATVLIHDGVVGLNGPAIKAESYHKYMRKKIYEQCERFLSCCEIPKKTLMRKINDEWLISADEAIELGLADHIVESISDVLPCVLIDSDDEAE